MKRSLFLLAALLSFSFALAQEKIEKPKPDLDAEVVVNKKRFKVYNNWLSGYGGAGYNTVIPQLQFIGGLDFNFHIKEHYLQLGAALAGDDFGNYNNTIFHAGYGKRKENEKLNLSAFGGLSYTKGYRKKGGVYDITNPYEEPGLYINAQAVKKITYDVGIGLGLFADINQVRTLAGVVGVVYFSGAYRGKKQ
jgi:hypothetical protein